MPLAKSLLQGLASLIDNAAIAEFTTEAGKKAISVLKAHFTFSAREISKAYQDCFAQSLGAIHNTLSQKNSWLNSKLTQDFSEQFSAQLLNSGIQSQDLTPFLKNKSNLFQIDSVDESDLAGFINAQNSAALTNLLLEQLQLISFVDANLIKALRKDDLLANIMRFFLREQFRNDSRFEKTLLALQNEALLFNQQRMLNLMAELQISSRVKVSDEFTHHNTKTREIIQKSVLNLKAFSSDLGDYTNFSLMLGSAVSSTGNLDKSDSLFSQIIDSSNTTDDERGMAFFNRFQVRLRGKNYDSALSDLIAAIDINPDAYALHDVNMYPLLQILGVGGMGCVFLCKNYNPLKDQEKVVVKCFWDSLLGSGKSVFNEAIAMRKIAGDYVPEPLDAGYANRHEQKKAFFVTEYVEGVIDGEAWLQKYGVMDLAIGLEVALIVAKALHLAHENEILHLDLKPANLLLTDSSSALPVKIIDFGLAQIAPSLQQEALTRQNQSGLTQFGLAVMGTLHYAPPEQQGFVEYGVPTVRSDMFSFGATMYRFWTGESPRRFLGDKLPNVPKLRELLFDCLAENPKERPESAIFLVSCLEAVKEAERRQAKQKRKRVEDEKARKLEAVKEAERRQAEQKRKIAEDEKARKKNAQQAAVQIQERAVIRETNTKKIGWKWIAAIPIMVIFMLVVFVFPKTEKTQAEPPVVVTPPRLLPHDTFVAKKVFRDTLKDGSQGPEMVWIPKGSFQMGSNDWDRTKPVHEVLITQNFAMGKFEVTFEEYDKFAKATGREKPDDEGWGRENRPVINVSWNDATAYAKWLSDETGENYRLPTEAEWEYAARAGTKSKYWWGDDVGSNNAIVITVVVNGMVKKLLLSVLLKQIRLVFMILLVMSGSGLALNMRLNIKAKKIHAIIMPYSSSCAVVRGTSTLRGRGRLAVAGATRLVATGTSAFGLSGHRNTWVLVLLPLFFCLFSFGSFVFFFCLLSLARRRRKNFFWGFWSSFV